MNHLVGATAMQAGVSGAGAGAGGGGGGGGNAFNKSSQMSPAVPSRVTDVLQSLYKQMRESRHSGEAATFGGWSGFAGPGGPLMGGRRWGHSCVYSRLYPPVKNLTSLDSKPNWCVMCHKKTPLLDGPTRRMSRVPSPPQD